MEKLLIFDLDDTIFETKSIGPEPVAPVIDGLREILSSHFDRTEVSEIVNDSWKYPFDFLAHKYAFHQSIVVQFASLINETDFHLDIEAFEDFALIAPRREKKILVTTGFEKLQLSKIEALGISPLFEEIIIDNQADDRRIHKKGIFEHILDKYQRNHKELLVIGDNPNSELQAGYELGIPTVQVAKFDQPRAQHSNQYISHYKELVPILDS